MRHFPLCYTKKKSLENQQKRQTQLTTVHQPFLFVWLVFFQQKPHQVPASVPVKKAVNGSVDWVYWQLCWLPKFCRTSSVLAQPSGHAKQRFGEDMDSRTALLFCENSLAAAVCFSGMLKPKKPKYLVTSCINEMIHAQTCIMYSVCSYVYNENSTKCR